MAQAAPNAPEEAAAVGHWEVIAVNQNREWVAEMLLRDRTDGRNDGGVGNLGAFVDHAGHHVVIEPTDRGGRVVEQHAELGAGDVVASTREQYRARHRATL